MKAHVKILFSVEGPSGSDVESLWAVEDDEGYIVDNIPFYAREVALGDLIRTKMDEDGALWFDGIVRGSGHSTIRLWFTHAEDVSDVRSQLRTIGCASELSELPRLVAVDVPPEVPYEQVKILLEQGEAGEVFEYEEACLGFLG